MKIFTLLALVLSLSLSAQANNTNHNTINEVLDTIIDLNSDTSGFYTDGWTVGDRADYSLKMGFINGSMKTFLREETEVGYWLQQDVSLGPFGKQKIEVLYDKATFKVLELRVNGKKENPPKQGEMEIIETREDKIDVPAGTFETLYARILNKSDNKEIQAWINPEVIPLGGMVKNISPSQLGEMVLELTEYKRQ